MSDSDELFVIDKKGENEKSVVSNVIYFASQTRLGEKPTEEVKSTEKNPHKRKGPVNAKRYHQTDDYSDLRPGKLSKELREALNLSKYDIPFHIYRMRSLGYPPGWLKKARVGDGLTIFDSVFESVKRETVTYNRDALIKYPGFNDKLDYRSIDHHVYLNCMPMQNHHMLDNFFTALSQKSGCDAPPHTDESDDELCRLRAERERILNEIRRLDSKVSVSEEVDNDDAKKTVSADSPGGSIGDADAAQPEPSTTSQGEASSKEPTAPDDEKEQVLTVNITEDGTYTPNQSLLSLDSPQVGEAGGTACSTPIGKPKRPSLEAFTVGVQPYRPFDNLPGSQGTYQRVLKTLRDSVAKTNSQKVPRGESKWPEVVSPVTPECQPDSGRDHWSVHVSLPPITVDGFPPPRTRESLLGHCPPRPMGQFPPGNCRPPLLGPPGNGAAGYPRSRYHQRR